RKYGSHETTYIDQLLFVSFVKIGLSLLIKLKNWHAKAGTQDTDLKSRGIRRRQEFAIGGHILVVQQQLQIGVGYDQERVFAGRQPGNDIPRRFGFYGLQVSQGFICIGESTDDDQLERVAKRGILRLQALTVIGFEVKPAKRIFRFRY